MHPNALTTGCLSHPDIDNSSQRATRSSMEDGDIQNLQQTSIESSTAECISSEGVYTQMIGEPASGLDSQRPNLSLNYFPPPYKQLAHSVFPDPHWSLATEPSVVSPCPMSGAGIQLTLTPVVSDEKNPGDEFGRGHGLENDRIWANDPRPGRRITGQEDSFRGTNSPYNHGNGDDVHVRNLNPNSPFERHPDQRVETPEYSGFQQIPEMETARGSRIRLIGPKEWPCDRDGCNKSYTRRQDVKRHVRETHGILPKCLICGIKWTRAENIRRHLIKKHRDHFTKKERQQIRHLRGLNSTINFLNEWETTRL